MPLVTLHAIANVLRKIRLLQLVDWILYKKSLIINRRINREFISTNNNFPVPPPHLAFDAYNHTNWKSYFDSGLMHAKVIADILNKEMMTDNSIRIFEWGSGPGRVIRHLQAELRYKYIELYGSDYNAESIKWCRDNIKGIRFFINQAKPPFPFEADFFDCIYAISVFTHLSEEMHFEWIRELRRVMKPNGLLILTTHGDSSRDRLLLREKQLYDSGKLIVRGDVKEGKKWYLAYHPPRFIKNKLLKNFNIVSHSYFSHTQEIWVARK